MGLLIEKKDLDDIEQRFLYRDINSHNVDNHICPNKKYCENIDQLIRIYNINGYNFFSSFIRIKRIIIRKLEKRW